MEIREDEAVDELFRGQWHASASVQHYSSSKTVPQVVRPAKDHREDERLQTSARFQVTFSSSFSSSSPTPPLYHLKSIIDLTTVLFRFIQVRSRDEGTDMEVHREHSL